MRLFYLLLLFFLSNLTLHAASDLALLKQVKKLKTTSFDTKEVDLQKWKKEKSKKKGKKKVHRIGRKTDYAINDFIFWGGTISLSLILIFGVGSVLLGSFGLAWLVIVGLLLGITVFFIGLFELIQGNTHWKVTTGFLLSIGAFIGLLVIFAWFANKYFD